MKKLFFLLILIASGVAVFKGCISVENTDSTLQPGKMELTMKRTKIKQISELATATQTVTLFIDTNYNSTKDTDLKILFWKINIKKELKENRLQYVQCYRAKAGFRDVAVYRCNDSLYTVESLPCELLSFELITDSLLLEQGTWSKRATIEMESVNKAKALQNIKQDSLFSSAQTNFRKYITELVRNITNTEGFIIQFKNK